MKTKTLAQLGEDALVRRLTRGLPLASDVIAGVGDDCAVVKPLAKGWLQLLKTDCVVEGIHFTRGTAPQQVGRKAMARAISDIGAMGGEPQHALVTLLCPQDREVVDVEKLYAGLRKGAAEFGVSIVGGETSCAPLLAIIISLTGRVRKNECLLRDGAKPGDLIYVTGSLGGSLAKHHLDFTPRVKEAQWLAAHAKPHAMMDLSDGLAKDLPRMAAASGVEFVVDESSLPCSKGCSPEQAWGDGEDYELLLAVSARSAASLEKKWARQYPKLRLTKIGQFVTRGRGQTPSFYSKGWEHFHEEKK
jgi:thiamine-monophosphate kinase